MKILAILQARMSSSRLPGKILKPILGKPMLTLQIERVLRARCIDSLIVATSTDPSDNPVEELCQDLGVECFRGSLDNVLDRYFQAAKHYKAQNLVRLTGDCPLADPDVIDEAIQYFLDHDFDYVTNGGDEPTFPDGLDVEVLKFSALKAAWENATQPSDIEHVTPYITKQPEEFKLGVFKGHPDRSHMRWTVDAPRDFEFVYRVYQELYPVNPQFGTDDILDLLQRKPEIGQINSDIERNEGLKKSLAIDKGSNKP